MVRSRACRDTSDPMTTMTTTNLLATSVWKVDLDWFFVAKAAPVLDRDRVIVRCGPKVLALDVATGDVCWALVLDPPAGNETFFIALANGGWVTDIHRQPERLTTVVAIEDGGTQRWRADLPSIGGARGAIAVVDGLVLPAKRPGKGQELVRFAAPVRDGTFDLVALDHGITRLVPGSAGRVIAADGVAAADAPGLYSVELDGRDPVTWTTGPVVDLDAAGDHVVAIVREDGASVAVAFDRATGARRWQAVVSADVVATAADLAITVEGGEPIARTLSDGTIRWRGTPRAHRTTGAVAAGGIVFLAHDRGRELVALSDGADLGMLPSGYGAPAVADDAIYLAGQRAVMRIKNPLAVRG